MAKVYDEVGPFTVIPNRIFQRAPEIGASAFLVLLALAMRADDKYRAWPSLKTISSDTGLSKRAISTAISKLSELGIITKLQRFNDSTVYTLNFKLGDANSAPIADFAIGDANSAIPDANSAPGVVQNLQPNKTHLNQTHLTRPIEQDINIPVDAPSSEPIPAPIPADVSSADEKPVNDLEQAFVAASGLPVFAGGIQPWFEAFRQMSAGGVGPDEIKRAIEIMRAKYGPKAVVRPHGIIRVAIGLAAERQAQPEQVQQTNTDLAVLGGGVYV